MPLASTRTGPNFAAVAVITTVDALAGFVVGVEPVDTEGCVEGVTVAFDDPHAARAINAATPSASCAVHLVLYFICVTSVPYRSIDIRPGAVGSSLPDPTARAWVQRRRARQGTTIFRMRGRRGCEHA